MTTGRRKKDPPKKTFVHLRSTGIPMRTPAHYKIGEKHYHNKLTRNVGGEDLVAILVPPTADEDLPPFYMLENKITNKVFKAVWEAGKDNTSPKIHNTLQNTTKKTKSKLPCPWGRGEDKVKDFDGKVLGIDGTQEGVPVLGVTVPEAVLVAAELGGRLPTHAQYKKAVGARGDDKDKVGRPMGADCSERDQRSSGNRGLQTQGVHETRSRFGVEDWPAPRHGPNQRCELLRDSPTPFQRPGVGGQKRRRASWTGAISSTRDLNTPSSSAMVGTR